MGVLEIDERRRITLPREFVEKYGEKYMPIRTKDGILLKPFKKVTLDMVQKEFEKVKGVSIKKLREKALKAGVEEAEKGLK